MATHETEQFEMADAKYTALAGDRAVKKIVFSFGDRAIPVTL